MSLSYNGVNFTYPRTEVNVAGPGMDPSNSDQLYTVIRLKVRAYLNPELLPSGLVDLGSVANTYTRIRHYLTQPRAPLYYDLTSAPGATSAAPMISLPDGRDDANGPVPDQDAFSVVYTTPQTLEISWSCTIKLRDCGFALAATPLSLRWEDTIEFDRYWKATYRRVGTMILSSRSTASVDEYRRTLLAPSVAPGFAREAAHYTVSRDGLRCDFAFIDGQIRYAPPFPAVDMDIIQQETLPLLGGVRKGQISVSMKGIISANPVDLQNQCMAIAYSRLNASNPFTTDTGRVIGNGVFRTAEAKDGIQADFSLSYKVTPPKTTQNKILGALKGWGSSIPGIGDLVNQGLNYFEGVPSQQGNPTDRTPVFPWVGFGTTPISALNQMGQAGWANQAGSTTGPADGVLLAPAVKLFAALLNDPCGSSLSSTPVAGPVDVDIRTDSDQFNTLAGGQGGATQLSTGQLSASLSALNASEYPTTLASTGSGSLYSWDGQPGAYDFWQCQNEYLGDPGVIVVPTSSTIGTNAAIAHSSEMTTLRKRWAASRTGSPPRLPPTDLQDDNWVFVNRYEGLREMRVASDGVSIVYEATGIYEYQALDSSLVKREAEFQPFLVAAPFEGSTGAASWVEQAASLVAGAFNGVLTGSGGNPLGGNQLP